MENSFSNIQDFWETSSSNNGAVLTGNPNESLINSSQVKENKLFDILRLVNGADSRGYVIHVT